MDAFDRAEIWSGFALRTGLELGLFRSVFRPWLSRRPERLTVLDVKHELDPARLLGRLEFSPGPKDRSELDSCTLFIIPADDPQEMISVFFVLDDFEAGKIIVSYKGQFYASSKDGHFRINRTDENDSNETLVDSDQSMPSGSRSSTRGKEESKSSSTFGNFAGPLDVNPKQTFSFEFNYDRLLDSLSRLLAHFKEVETAYENFARQLGDLSLQELWTTENTLRVEREILQQTLLENPASMTQDQKIKLNMLRYSDAVNGALDTIPIPYNYARRKLSAHPEYSRFDEEKDRANNVVKSMPPEMAGLLSKYVFEALNARSGSDTTTFGKIKGDKDLSAAVDSIALRAAGLAKNAIKMTTTSETTSKKRKATDPLARIDKRTKIDAENLDRLNSATVLNATEKSVEQLIESAAQMITQNGFAVIRNYISAEKLKSWRVATAQEFNALLQGKDKWERFFETMKTYKRNNPTWETRQLPCLAYMNAWQEIKRETSVQNLLRSVIEKVAASRSSSSSSDISPSAEGSESIDESQETPTKPKKKSTGTTENALLYGIDCPWFSSVQTANQSDISAVNDNMMVDVTKVLRNLVHAAPVKAEKNNIQSYMILAKDVDLGIWLQQPDIIVEVGKQTRSGAIYFFKRASAKKTKPLENSTHRDTPLTQLAKSAKEQEYGLVHGNFASEDIHPCYEYFPQVGDIVLMAPSTRRRHTFNFKLDSESMDDGNILQGPFIIGAPLSARLGPVVTKQDRSVATVILNKRALPYAAKPPLIFGTDATNQPYFNDELKVEVQFQAAADLYSGAKFTAPQRQIND